MKTKTILSKLKSLSNPKNVAEMAHYGINPEKNYGVQMPVLREMAKELGKDHKLAQELWELGIRETRLLATMVDDPALVSEAQMERRVKDFNSWDICDGCVMNLFAHTKLAWQKAIEWSLREEEFVKRAGFVLMARLAVGSSKIDDKELEKFLPLIKKEAVDDRNYVKKAVNWALRQIGKRNLNLNRLAIKTAKEIQSIDNKTTRWVASDALRELTSKAIQEKLRLG